MRELCVFKPILAPNCRLLIEQVNSDSTDSDDDLLAFDLRSLRFLITRRMSTIVSDDTRIKCLYLSIGC